MSERRPSQKLGMHEVISFLPPIQVGYEIYYENLEIQEIEDRQTAVWHFIQGSNQSLDWEQEPSNPHNPHAIKLFGISEQMFSTKREMLGYVPADVGKEIINSGLWPFMQLRLDCIYAAGQGFVAIRFQILGPIRKKKSERTRPEDSALKDEQLTAIGSSLFTDRSEKSQGYRMVAIKIGKAVLRVIAVALGMGFAFVGGKIGTALWQAGENIFSIIMLLPILLVISGGLLVWAGIKPSTPPEETTPGTSA